MYKLVAIDIDGTLLNSYGEVSQRNKDAIRKAINKGIQIILTSGRMPKAIMPIANQINANKYIISGNGAAIYDIENKVNIYQNYMKKEKILEIIDICDINSMFYSIYTNNVIIAKSLNYNILYYNSENKKNPEDKKIKMNITTDIYNYVKEYSGDDFLKVTICDGNQIVFNSSINKLKKIKGIDILEVAHMSRKIIKHGTEECPIEYFYTEISNKNVNKWTAIEKLIEKLNIKKEEVIAIGDNVNDQEMLKNAGLGIAMGNSSPNVKKTADYVVSNNNESGVAEAFEKYIES